MRRMNETPPISSAADSTIPVMPLSSQLRLTGEYPDVASHARQMPGRLV